MAVLFKGSVIKEGRKEGWLKRWTGRNGTNGRLAVLASTLGSF